MAKNSAAAAVETGVVTVDSINHTAKLNRNDHPGNRSTYTIAGHTGSIVVKNSLFANGIAPATISFDCEMVAPKDGGRNGQAKIAKLNAAIAKAEAMLAAAQAKVAAAQAASAEKVA